MCCRVLNQPEVAAAGATLKSHCPKPSILTLSHSSVPVTNKQTEKSSSLCSAAHVQAQGQVYSEEQGNGERQQGQLSSHQVKAIQGTLQQ
jgi:hypothetical protein